MELNARYDLKLLGIAEDEFALDRVELHILRFSDNFYGPFQNNRYFMVRRVSECDDMSYDMIFNDVRSAVKEFGKEARKKVRLGGREEFAYGPVRWTEHWPYIRDELIPCGESYEKDYGPSNPWDAPGMKISDFLPGVY